MKNKIVSFSKSLRFVFELTFKIDKKLFLLNLFFYVLLAVLPLSSLWMLKLMVDKVIAEREIFNSNMYLFIGGFISIQVLNSFVSQWSSYFLQKQQFLISEHISLRVLTKAGEIDYSYYEDPAYYDALHMTQNQSAYLPSHIIATLQIMVQQIITIVALAGFLISVHWVIPILLIVFSLPLAITKLIYGKKQFQLEKSIIPERRKANDFFNYITTNTYAKELRVFSFGTFFRNQFSLLQQSIYQKRNMLHFLHMQRGMLISFLEVLFVTFFYLILISRSIGGLITVGGLIIYFQAFQRLQTAVNALFNSAITLFQNQLYLQEIIQYLSLPTDRSVEKLVDVPDLSDVLDIEISNLNFSYPGKDKVVLSDISMRFLKGQYIAIVGDNGSGKSTLLKLLCGLYKTSSGSLTFNGINANDLPASFFSSHISVVFQDFGKYYMTVEDNIAIGQEAVDRNKITFSLNMATGGNLPSSLHSGIDTTLGRTQKLGEELSGGEWQKIAIARALYKDCDVLILDEPTSSIDPVAEVEFFQSLRKNNANNIVILITHRLYNLKMADHIYVMESGRLAESGTFTELIELNGFFSKYYNAQKI